jgi:single-stranded DNA-binding protein
MPSLSVTGIARLTRDAEIKQTQNGIWYYFGIAVYRKPNKKAGQTADFFDAEVYAKERKPEFDQSLVKGKLLYIEKGYLRNDQFTGTDGTQKNKIKVLINAFEVLSEKVAPAEIEKPIPKNSIHPSDLPPPLSIPKPYTKAQAISDDDEYPTEETDGIPF